MRIRTALLTAFLCLAAPAALFPQTVSQVVNTVAVGGITGLGTGVATLLAGTSSGTVGLVGTTSPTLVTPVLGAATATSINFGGSTLSTYTVADCSSAIGITGASTPGTGQTYSIKVCSSEITGRQATVRFTFVMTSVGTASGNLQLTLPIQAANIANDFGGCYIYGYVLASATALNYGITGTIAPNASLATFNTNAATGQAAITVANLGSSGTLQGICNYRAS